MTVKQFGSRFAKTAPDLGIVSCTLWCYDLYSEEVAGVL